MNITIWDLTPEAYMDKLGFTQEEKDWAALLYSVLRAVGPQPSQPMVPVRP